VGAPVDPGGAPMATRMVGVSSWSPFSFASCSPGRDGAGGRSGWSPAYCGSLCGAVALTTGFLATAAVLALRDPLLW